MYAVIETGGKQYRVKPGDVVEVDRLAAEPGGSVRLERVLMIGGEGTPTIGTPFVQGARVVAEVVDQVKGDRIVVFRFKAKSRYRRKTGHRQPLTRLRITGIERGEEERGAQEGHGEFPKRPRQRRAAPRTEVR